MSVSSGERDVPGYSAWALELKANGGLTVSWTYCEPTSSAGMSSCACNSNRGVICHGDRGVSH